jgi:hypothetical protein
MMVVRVPGIENVEFVVPQGRPTIALRFIAGIMANKPAQAPKGRKKTPDQIATFCRP